MVGRSKVMSKAKGKSASRRRVRSITPSRLAALTASSSDPTLDNLAKFDHLVVLMLENRSFDHILGYQKLDGRPVDGLDPSMTNPYQGLPKHVYHAGSTTFEPDPCHKSSCATQQLSGGTNRGFIDNFASVHTDLVDPWKIMGYYDATDLPTYDYLSREFCVCDRWFSCVPGQTWPNRLYALTGGSDGNKDNQGVPLYSLKSFLRHLDTAGVSWRWYCHDISTLRLTDSKYRTGHAQNFFWFDRRTPFDPTCFLDHAKAGGLPAVSWIDPNFVDFGLSKTFANDDHPPSDMRAGQRLVLTLYNALRSSPAWDRTLLVVTYDEHGGFFDHVSPVPVEDDRPSFRTSGLRVPALVIGPSVGKGSVSSMVFDHTSIIKTILLRYCKKPDGSTPDMGARVRGANHLGSLLTEAAPRAVGGIGELAPLMQAASAWAAEAEMRRLLAQASSPAFEGLKGRPQGRHATSSRAAQVRQRAIEKDVSQRLDPFQQKLVEARRKLKEKGLPEGRP